MKSKFFLNYILGSVIFVSQLASEIAALTTEQHSSLATCEDIEEYAIDAAENILKTAGAILNIPPEQQTFENTLRSWNRLNAKLSQNFNRLAALVTPDSPSSATASQAFDDLGAFLLEITQNPQLYQTLMDCSQRIAHDAELDSFQRYIASRFFKNASHKAIYLRGSSDKNNSSTADFTVLNLKYGFEREDHASHLTRRILSENADLVCIQEVFADDDAYSLYEVLQDDYAHFVYIPFAATLDLPGGHRDTGLLIASKCSSLLPQFPANLKFEILPIKSHRNRDESNGRKSCEGGITGKWGDGKGVQWEGYIKGEAHDGKGNYAEGQITQKDDGTGEVNVRGGHESENK